MVVVWVDTLRRRLVWVVGCVLVKISFFLHGQRGRVVVGRAVRSGVVSSAT